MYGVYRDFSFNLGFKELGSGDYIKTTRVVFWFITKREDHFVPILASEEEMKAR